ncbi:MAG: Ig domain-containing protein, partial [Bacteroidota bacterium]
MESIRISSEDNFGLCVWGTRIGYRDFVMKNIFLPGAEDSPWTALVGNKDPRGLFTTEQGMPYVYHIAYKKNLIAFTVFQHIFDNTRVGETGRNGFLALSLFYDNSYKLDFNVLLGIILPKVKELELKFIRQSVLSSSIDSAMKTYQWNLPSLSSLDTHKFKPNRDRSKVYHDLVYGLGTQVDRVRLLSILEWTYIYGREEGYFILPEKFTKRKEHKLPLLSTLEKYEALKITRRIEIKVASSKAHITLKNNRNVTLRAEVSPIKEGGLLRFEGPIEDADFPLAYYISEPYYDTQKIEISLKELIDGSNYFNIEPIILQERAYTSLAILDRMGKPLPDSDFVVIHKNGNVAIDPLSKIYEDDYPNWIDSTIKPMDKTLLKPYKIKKEDLLKGRVILEGAPKVDLKVRSQNGKLLKIDEDYTLWINKNDKHQTLLNLEMYESNQEIEIEIRSSKYGNIPKKVYSVETLLSPDFPGIELPKNEEFALVKVKVTDQFAYPVEDAEITLIGNGIRETFPTNQDGIAKKRISKSDNSKLNLYDCTMSIVKEGYEPILEGRYDPNPIFNLLTETTIIPIKGRLDSSGFKVKFNIDEQSFDGKMIVKRPKEENQKPSYHLEVELPKLEAELLRKKPVEVDLVKAPPKMKLKYREGSSLEMLMDRGIKIVKESDDIPMKWLIPILMFLILGFTGLFFFEDIQNNLKSTPDDNHAPQLTNGSIPPQNNKEGDKVTLDLTEYFTDEDKDDLTFKIDSLPNGLKVDDNGMIEGTLKKTSDSSRIYTVKVNASDENGGSFATSFKWTISSDEVKEEVIVKGSEGTDEMQKSIAEEERRNTIDSLKNNIAMEILTKDFNSTIAKTLTNWKNELVKLEAWESVSNEIGKERIELYKELAFKVDQVVNWKKYFVKEPVHSAYVKSYNEKNMKIVMSALCEAHNSNRNALTDAQREF